MLKSTLLLLAIIGIASTSLFEKQKKVGGVLKNVGKRYLANNPHLTRMMLDRQGKGNWMNVPPDFAKKFKENVAEQITFHIRWQSSIEDKDFPEHAKVLFAIMDDDLTVEICDDPQAKMNKVQFGEYLKRQRSSYIAIENDAPYSFVVTQTENDVLKMEVTLEMTSKWNYKTTITWDITAKFTEEESSSLFKMKHIIIGGGCTTHGVVNHKFTELSTRQDALEQLKKEKNPDVQALFDLFTPGPMKFREQNPEIIPTIWLEGLERKWNLFNCSICDDRQDMPRRYTRYKFRAWYDKFSLMWHPKEGDNDYITVQMININEKELTARITMRLEIGLHHNTTESFDWNFMIIASFNQHGDQTWRVTQLDVLCHPHFRLMDKYLFHVREYIFDNFVQHIERTPKPVPEHTLVDFVRQFTKNGSLNYEYCDKKVMYPAQYNYGQLMLSVFFSYIKTPVQSCMYWMDYTEVPLPAQETSHFIMRTLSSPDKRPPARWVFENVWIFAVIWDNSDQFYYINNIKLTCLKEKKEIVKVKHYKEYIKMTWAGGK